MPAMPENSTDKFSNQGGGEMADQTENANENADAEVGEDYEAPTGQDEPAIMLTQGQADAAGMSGAMPGDKFTLSLTVASQADDGWNVSIDPGSAVKAETVPPMDQTADAMMPSRNMSGSTVKGPEAFDLGLSPAIGNT